MSGYMVTRHRGLTRSFYDGYINKSRAKNC